MLSLLVGVSVSHAQTITWKALPFPSDSDWSGPTGQLAVVTANEVVLDGQPVRSEQQYTEPTTINCDMVLDASTSGGSALWLFLIPTGQSIHIIDFTNSVFLQVAYDDDGQGTIGLYQRHSPAPDTALWSTNYTIIVGATNHVTMGVATNGELSLSMNGQPYDLPDTAAISFSQFQVEAEGWQPNDIWGVLNASAESCAFRLSATNVTLAAKGGSKHVSVKVKSTDCPWTAVSNDPFITITSGTSGTGGGRVNYTVPGNTNTTALTGTMTIAGQTVTVNQAAGGCAYSFSPKVRKIKAGGGPATVKVKPNFNDCVWTAVSNDPFITITDGVSGLGDGTVSYTVAANTNATTVTGTITIGGETFTVIQSGQ
jgi:hypothetical protein